MCLFIQRTKTTVLFIVETVKRKMGYIRGRVVPGEGVVSSSKRYVMWHNYSVPSSSDESANNLSAHSYPLLYSMYSTSTVSIYCRLAYVENKLLYIYKYGHYNKLLSTVKYGQQIPFLFKPRNTFILKMCYNISILKISNTRSKTYQ